MGKEGTPSFCEPVLSTTTQRLVRGCLGGLAEARPELRRDVERQAEREQLLDDARRRGRLEVSYVTQPFHTTGGPLGPTASITGQAGVGKETTQQRTTPTCRYSDSSSFSIALRNGGRGERESRRVARERETAPPSSPRRTHITGVVCEGHCTRRHHAHGLPMYAPGGPQHTCATVVPTRARSGSTARCQYEHHDLTNSRREKARRERVSQTAQNQGRRRRRRTPP